MVPYDTMAAAMMDCLCSVSGEEAGVTLSGADLVRRVRHVRIFESRSDDAMLDTHTRANRGHLHHNSLACSLSVCLYHTFLLFE